MRDRASGAQLVPRRLPVVGEQDRRDRPQVRPPGVGPFVQPVGVDEVPEFVVRPGRDRRQERHLDAASGVQLNANIDQYKIVGSRETPQIEVHLIEQLGGQSSTDARGIAEPANVATAAAIANAFFNATGKRILELPLTPANVLAALRSAE